MLAIADFVPGDVDKGQMIADYVNDQIDVVGRLSGSDPGRALPITSSIDFDRGLLFAGRASARG
jgi:hypothetical protein